MERPRTRQVVLHHLSGVKGIEDAPLAIELPEALTTSVSAVRVADCAGVWFEGQSAPGASPAWAQDAAVTLGRDPGVYEQRAGGVLPHVDGAQVFRVVFRPSSLHLPGWPAGWDEGRYNEYVGAHVPGFTCLDRRLVRDADLHRRPGLEVCDLLGPDGELVHVKRAKGSAALSHLFQQGLVSFHSLSGIAETRRNFTRLAAAHGRVLDDGWAPRRVVFAILLGDGRPLTPQTLFPFARASLAQAAAAFRSRDVSLAVIGLDGAEAVDAA